MRPRDIPNLLSVLRIVIVIPTVLALLDEQYQVALLMLMVAGLSDALDGYLAKRNRWESRLGSVLDPVADKSLLVSCYLALGWLGHIPIWLVAAVIARDVIIVLGAFAYYWLIGRYEMAPTLASKVNTFAQILYGVAVVATLAIGFPDGELIQWLALVVLATTALSGLDYVWTWGVRAWRAKQGSPR